jgi:hypothetical protein
LQKGVLSRLRQTIGRFVCARKSSFSVDENIQQKSRQKSKETKNNQKKKRWFIFFHGFLFKK